MRLPHAPTPCALPYAQLGELSSDDPYAYLGKTSDDDRTGLQLWAASLVLARWLVELRSRLAGRGVIELGAGCGLCGIVAARVCQATPVHLTDLAEPTMNNLHHNMALNRLEPPDATACVLDWRRRETWPAPQPIVIGADLVYAIEVRTCARAHHHHHHERPAQAVRAL